MLWRNDGPQDRAIPQAAETRRTVDSRRRELPGARFSRGGLRPAVYRAGPGFARLGCRRQRVCGLHRLLGSARYRSVEHTSELQSPCNLVCRLLLEKKKKQRPTADFFKTKIRTT